MNTSNNLVTIVLLIHNAEKYIDIIYRQLEIQTYSEYNLLIIDNNSTDQSFEQLANWGQRFGRKTLLVRNKSNLGGMGSLYANLNKIETDWFLLMHQDDAYKSNHVEVISKLIHDSDKSTVGVTTTMGSMNSSGKVLVSKPRATWFSPKMDEVGQFLQNLRSQSVPYPAAAFNLEIFKKCRVLIHSPTCSDTEQTLKMLAYGRFEQSELETMYYRENPVSESKVLNDEEKAMGTLLSLNRVLQSQEFLLILDKVPFHRRYEFGVEIERALKTRIQDNKISHFLFISALEQMIQYWGYNEKNIALLLFDRYSKLSSGLTCQILNKLSNLGKLNTSVNKVSISPKFRFSARVWDYYFAINNKFVKKYNKTITTSVYKFVFKFKKNHIFKNHWDKE